MTDPAASSTLRFSRSEIVSILSGLMLAILCNRNLRRLPKPKRKPAIDWLGAVLILASTTPILIAVDRAGTAGGWGRIDVLVPLVIGIVLMAGLVVWDLESHEPMIPLRLFANRIFSVGSAISFSMSMVMIAMIILVPLDLELAAGLAPNEAGIRLIPMTGSIVLGSFIAGSLVSRTGRYRIFPICGAAAMTIICVVISFAGLGRWWPLDTVPTTALGLSFGFQLLFALPFHPSQRIDAGFGNRYGNVSRTYNADHPKGVKRHYAGNYCRSA